MTASPFAAWLDDWSLRSMGPEWLPLEVFARQDDHVKVFRSNLVHGLVGIPARPGRWGTR